MGVKLFVGNLAYSITEQEIREAFSQSGRTVQTVRIAVDRETQRPRGFAFVEMASEGDAQSAIQEWNVNILSGRNIFVEKAQERAPGAPRPAPRPRPFGPASGTGGYRSGPPRDRAPMASAETNKEEQRRRQARPEKRNEKRRTGEGRPREEERERGKWRWDGSDDY